MINPINIQQSPYTIAADVTGPRLAASTGRADSIPDAIPEAKESFRRSSSDRIKQDIGAKECETCSSRKYRDGSNDPGVSFKSATHVSPGASGAAVAAHENEHVRNQQMKAQTEGRKIVSQIVQIYTAVCPECGRSYTSGGKTTTVTADQPHSSHTGKNIDTLI